MSLAATHAQQPRADSPAAIDDSPRHTIKRVLMGTGLPEDLADGYAELICREFSGCEVYFAVRHWNLSARDARIRADRDAGRSLTWLAQHHRLSRTQIRRICGLLPD